ncbi:MAG: 4-hydroxy-tetrahydrodipicolinate reductase [Sandaracinaceae bacterium]
MIRIAVHGATGRMGGAILALLRDADDLALAAAYTAKDDPRSGDDLDGVTLSPIEPGTALSGDVVIDFSSLAGLRALAKRDDVPALVSGTTGLTDDDRAALAALAQRAPVVWAPNMSVGVNVLFYLAEEAARRLGPGFDAEIVEMHHRYKVDAPSGTAMRLAERVAKGKGLDRDAFVYGREGAAGPRRDDEIGVMTLRGGGVIGEHTLYLTDAGERIELTHRAFDRAIFARGALTAARWVHGKRPGLYTMADVLGLSG